MTVTIYKSSDSNAPVLSGTVGALVNVFKKCLVEGYGDKQAAGWTMPFANTEETIAAFRNNQANGTGFYLQVDHSNTSTPYYVTMKGFELMTAYDVGINGFGNTGAILAVNTSAGTSPRSWLLVATDTWMYFFVWKGWPTFPTHAEITAASSYVLGGINMFFGDYEKLNPDFGYNCAFFYNDACNSSGSFGFFGRCCGASNIASQAYHYIARGANGAVGAVPVGVLCSPPGTSVVTLAFGSVGPAYSVDSGLIVSKVAINNGVANSLIGYLPDMVVPCHPHPFTHDTIEEIAGFNYYNLIFRVQYVSVPAAGERATFMFKLQ